MQQRDHRLGVRLDALLAAISEDPREDSAAIGKVCARLQDVLHLECRASLQEIKRLWAPYDPNPEGVPRPDRGLEGLGACWDALDKLLTKANYQPVDGSELSQALSDESVFPLALQTRLEDFAELRIWRRGLVKRTEHLPTFFGLRRKPVEVEYFERVVLGLRFQDASHFGDPPPKKLPFVPGEATIKLFQDVPTNDIEMLFPNTAVKMRWLDHIVFWAPTVFGAIGVLAKALGPLLVVAGLLWLRFKDGGGRPLEQSEWAAITLAGSATVGIVMFSMRQRSRFKARKIMFLQELTKNLYFRSLDNNAGVFHRILDSAEEEDTAEAALGYALLRWHGPEDIETIDAVGEAWLATRFGVSVDLETDDAFAKLERFGLARQEGGRWQALPPSEALAKLDLLWTSGRTSEARS